MNAKEVRAATHWIIFNDCCVLKVLYLPRERCYLAVLYDHDGKAQYGWHPIPHSCLSIPTECRNWNQTKWAIEQHAKQHNGIHSTKKEV